MTRLTLIPALFLAACACPVDDVICDPETGMCICDGPASSIAAEAPESRDRKPDVERTEKPEEPTDKEPDSATDPDGHREWRERRG